MNVTFSQTADAILGQHQAFRENLVAALGGLSGHCFIDGRVGRSPRDDSVVLLCHDREAITVTYHEFEDKATVQGIVKRWSNAAHEKCE